MDGVTDFAFRHMAVRHGHPDVVFTEFTPADGLPHAPEKILRDFEYSESERPIVAQIYGSEPLNFYRAAHVVCELGFDGLDVNMGCPSRSVTQKLCGARLITAPDLALEIMQAVRSGIDDWTRGQTLAEAGLPARVIDVVARMNLKRTGQAGPLERCLIPYSIKTRIGFNANVIEPWVSTLLRAAPAAITVHGRTLKQMYKGDADWSAIAEAARVARGSGTLVLGNGDLCSLEEAQRRIAASGADGALIGRAAIGNPWLFRRDDRSVVTQADRIKAALEHAAYFVSQRPSGDFNSVRKHLGGYLKSFPEAASFRDRAVRTRSLDELVSVLG